MTKANPLADQARAAARPAQLASRRRRFMHDSRGAAAIEFAMIALPLFIMIGGIMEIALVFLISINVEDAAAAMARQIRIGAYIAPGEASAASITTFKNDLCADIKLVPTASCVQQIQVDVRPLDATFTTAATSPISGGVFSTAGLCFYSGSGGTPVLMRVYYLWPLLTPFLLNGLENVNSYGSSGAGRWAAVSATEVFVNEQTGSANTTGTSC